MSDEFEYYELLSAFEERGERCAALESQLAESRRREELLRAVAEAAKTWDYWDAQDALQAAIDGGAMEE